MTRKHTDNQLAEYWLKMYPDIRFDDGIHSYRMYVEGCWFEVANETVLETIKHLISEKEFGFTGATANRIKGVEYLIRLSIRASKDEWNSKPRILVMDTDTMEWAPDGSDFEFRDHDPQDYATRKLKFDYDPDATMPYFQKVLDDALPNKNDQRMLQEYFGLCLTTDTDYQAMLWIEGPPGSGKTTVLDALVGMLGNDTMAANVPIHATVDRFGLAHISGAVLLWSDDQTLRQIKRIGPMSELVDGNWIRVEAKNKDRMSIKSVGKVLWIMNVKPKIVDPEGINQGIWRRLNILKFAMGYDQRDVSLYKKVLAEKAGLFNFALDGLERLLKRGEWLPSTKSERYVESYRGSHGAVDVWVDECTQLADVRVRARDAYKNYINWCAAKDRGPASEISFAYAMERMGYEKRKSSPTGGQEYHGFRLY